MYNHVTSPTKPDGTSLSKPSTLPHSAGKRAVRGYKSQRALLHKSRNKSLSDILDTNANTTRAATRPLHHKGSYRQKGQSQEETDSGPIHSLNARNTRRAADGSIRTDPKLNNYISPIDHTYLLDDADPLRAASAPGSHTHPVNDQYHSSPNDSRPHKMSIPSQVLQESPLFTIRTAHTPSGDQVVREVNIEEAIRRSHNRVENGVVSQDRSHSLGDELSEQRHKFLQLTRNVRLVCVCIGVCVCTYVRTYAQ